MSHFDSFDQQWQRIHEALLEQKGKINRAIREYPLPITACDEQFNLLLEKRSTITRALGRLAQLNEENGAAQVDRDAALAAFITASQFVDETVVGLAEA